MGARVGVVVFPGSNCEHDVAAAIEAIGDGSSAELLWHGDRTTGGCDAVVVPGGFAHGDYLRPGAIARFSPVMSAIEAHAAAAGPVVGICNGFQILTEAGLLPGALRPNLGLRFICQDAEVEVISARSVLTLRVDVGRRLSIPINHYEGNYTCDDATLRSLESNDQVVLRYADNPNGSVASIAAVSNEAGNVVGLMPHPERASDPILGSADGLVLLASLTGAASARRAALGSPALAASSAG